METALVRKKSQTIFLAVEDKLKFIHPICPMPNPPGLAFPLKKSNILSKAALAPVLTTPPSRPPTTMGMHIGPHLPFFFPDPPDP